ncbi:MAG: amidohydrolase family protein [Chloroflexota bacterium]
MTTTRAELILSNGTIHTLDTAHPTAEAVAVANGHIVTVGTLEAVEATAHPHTRYIDLTGRTLIPGFNDAHLHIERVGLAAGSPTDSGFEAVILAAAKLLVRLGITNITDAGLTPPQLEAYRQLAADRRLPLRVNAIALRYHPDGTKIPLPERFESNWLRIDTIKLFADIDQSGTLRSTDDQMRAMVWDVHRAGLRATIHAVSEAAIEQAISAIEYASNRLVSRLKHRIEQCVHPTDDQIQRCRQSGINIVVRPILTQNPAPLRKLLDSGVSLGFGSNASAVPDVNPLVGMKAATTQITIAEALSLYTLGGALVVGEDSLKGSMVPGKYADFAILSGDPLRAPAERLSDLQVEMTLINGQVVYTLK